MNKLPVWYRRAAQTVFIVVVALAVLTLCGYLAFSMWLPAFI